MAVRIRGLTAGGRMLYVRPSWGRRAGDEPCPLQVLAYASASDGEPVQLAPAEVELGDLVKVSAPF